MKTKIVLISVFIFLYKPVISQEIDNFLGVYTIQEICSSSTLPGYIDTTDYEIEIVESSRDTFDIQYYMFMHFHDTIRAIVLNENEFQIGLQKFPIGEGDYLSISGEGSVYNDSIEINYYSGGPPGGFNCNCKGRNKDATGLLDGKNASAAFIVYPNPVKELLCLNLENLSSASKDLSLNIYNLKGDIVKSKKVYSIGRTLLNVSELETGSYLLCVSENEKIRFTSSFIKE